MDELWSDAQGRLTEARNCFNKAQALAPGYALVEVNLGVVSGALHCSPTALS